MRPAGTRAKMLLLYCQMTHHLIRCQIRLNTAPVVISPYTLIIDLDDNKITCVYNGFHMKSNPVLTGAVKKETSNRIFFKKIKKLFKSLFLTALPLKNTFQTKPLYSRNLNP